MFVRSSEGDYRATNLKEGLDLCFIILNISENFQDTMRSNRSRRGRNPEQEVDSDEEMTIVNEARMHRQQRNRLRETFENHGVGIPTFQSDPLDEMLEPGLPIDPPQDDSNEEQKASEV